VVAGSIPAATINVIDAKTEEPAWTLKMDLGIRPMTFSTKVVDIASMKERNASHFAGS
jgi:hypothetical protein